MSEQLLAVLADPLLTAAEAESVPLPAGAERSEDRPDHVADRRPSTDPRTRADVDPGRTRHPDRRGKQGGPAFEPEPDLSRRNGAAGRPALGGRNGWQGKDRHEDE